MSTTKQKYALYRDNTLIASDLPYLAVIEKYARADARREHAQERPACYVITGLSGFKRVGTHCKGMIRWEDHSLVHSCFGTPNLSKPAAATQDVQQHSHQSHAPKSNSA